MTQTPTPTWEEAINAIAEKYIPFERGTTARVRGLLKEDINKAVLELVIGENIEHKDWCAANREVICICGEVVRNELRAAQRRVVRGGDDDSTDN